MTVPAWTASIDQVRRIKHVMGGDIMYVLKLAVVCGDNNAVATVTLKSTKADPGNAYNEIMDQITGSWLYLAETEVVIQPDGTWDMDVLNNRSSIILDTDANSDTLVVFIAGSNTLGVYPPIMEEITVNIADLGTDKAVTVYLYFLK
jgi:hypothetical protein